MTTVQHAAQLTLTPGWTAVRLTLHILAATIWVGGQFVMMGLLPTARNLGSEAAKSLGRAFALLSWPAFIVLVLTGFWNVAALHGAPKASAWSAVLGVKYVLVILAGLGAWLHGRSTSRGAIGAWGSIAGVSSALALLAGVLLAS